MDLLPPSYRRACAAALGLVWSVLALPAHAADPFQRAQVLPTVEVAAATGRTLTEWGNAWWKWAFDHPEVLGDNTGKFGYLGNVPGPVFFAEASGGERFRGSVNVPRGEYVLLPVATYI
jgi:hypothetical protein